MWIISHISEKLTNCLSVLGHLAGLALRKFSFQKHVLSKRKVLQGQKVKKSLKKLNLSKITNLQRNTFIFDVTGKKNVA